jgi:hypothetical protein
MRGDPPLIGCASVAMPAQASIIGYRDHRGKQRSMQGAVESPVTAPACTVAYNRRVLRKGHAAWPIV